MHPKHFLISYNCLNTVLLLLRFAYEANRIPANHIQISGEPTTPAVLGYDRLSGRYRIYR